MHNNHTFSIAQFKIFHTLSQTELIKIIPSIFYKAFDTNEIMFDAGDPSEELFLVASGIFEISVQSGKKEVVVASFSEGDLFGEMAFFDQQTRSAACKAKVPGKVMILTKKNFDRLGQREPMAYAKILKNIYGIISHHSRTGNSFLSEMVQWGESARKRSITDTFTGLFNRSYFDDLLDNTIFDAGVRGSNFAVVMLDIDSFGLVNGNFGSAIADECVKILAHTIQKTVRQADSPARYGGDEFVMLLPNASIQDTIALCETLRKTIKKTLQQECVRLHNADFTISQGIAHFPTHANTKEALINAADSALYNAKKAGRNKAVIFNASTSNLTTKKKIVFESVPSTLKKTDIISIVARNKIINHINNAMLHRERFIILGHVECDEDCFASAVVCALMLKQFKKEVTLCMRVAQRRSFDFLQDICNYNGIPIQSPVTSKKIKCDTLIICDVAKPELIDAGSRLKAHLNNTAILKIEFDHHLGGDSQYIGSKNHCLVQRATSTCELLLFLCLKLQKQKESLARLHTNTIFTRNILFSLAIGISYDTGRGKFLHSVRDRKVFEACSRIIDENLRNETFDDQKATSIEDVLQISSEESMDATHIIKYLAPRTKRTPHIHYAILNWVESTHIAKTYEQSVIRNVMRTTANNLAEDSHFLGLAGYVDRTENDIFRFSLRRSHTYHGLDLRDILDQCDLQDGGGHEGAIGFRFPYISAEEAEQKVKHIIAAVKEHF